MTSEQKPAAVDWSQEGLLMEAAASSDARQHIVGTTNWAAAVYRYMAKHSAHGSQKSVAWPSNITEEMHIAAVKVFLRATGVDGLPRRMLDAMLAVAPKSPATQDQDRKVCATTCAESKAGGGCECYPGMNAPTPRSDDRAEQALLKVLDVTRRYLPPDGPSAHDAMTEIVGIVDPWPLGELKEES